MENHENLSTGLKEYIAGLLDTVEYLEFLVDIDAAILNGRDVGVVLDRISHRVCEFLGADLCCIALLVENNRLAIKSYHGFSAHEKNQLVKGLVDKKGYSCIRFSTEKGKMLAINDLDAIDLNEEIKSSYAHFGAKSVLTTSLLIGKQPIGSIVAWFKNKRDFDDTITKRFAQLAGRAAVAVKNEQLTKGTHNLTIEILRALTKAIDARDKYTANHSDRVSRFAIALAQELGFTPEEVQIIEYAGLLHDIGKIGIDERILNKPASLTGEEMGAMRRHSIMSAEIIEPIRFLKDAVEIVRHHHERFDGKGYPSGLRGEDIPVGARILAVADALEAMTSNRPYQLEVSLQQGGQELLAGSGAQFDPEMVKAMLRVISRVLLIEEFDWDEESHEKASDSASLLAD